MVFGILKNEFDDGHLNWARSCKKYQIRYNIIDLTSAYWLDEVIKTNYTGFLACPPGREPHYKAMYDERIYIIENVLNKFVYPNYQEISIHENKRLLSYWLSSNNIPHPKTRVFYNKNEVLSALETLTFPVVGKMNIGASGKGVEILSDSSNLNRYIERAFTKGLRQNWGPNLKMGGYAGRLKKILRNPSRILLKLKIYQKNYNAVQKDFLILQEYIKHDYEWRVVRIGDSYFGHQKIKQGDKASGTKGINYVMPPVSLLNFVKDLCTKYSFNSMAVDLFEDGKGGYLVNELQCIFGHVQDYICEKEGKAGRIKRINGNWEFEEGFYNSNLSYDLRLQNVLSIIKVSQFS